MLKLQKCIFIFKLLKQRAALTRNEINHELKKKWPEELPMSRSTFVRYKTYIEELFSCEISFSQVTKQYSMRNIGRWNHDDLVHFITSMYEVETSASLILKHKDCIHHVEYVTGTDKLHIVLQAIEKQRGIQADYSSFTNKTIKTRIFIPVFLTIWEGRWYCIAEVNTHPGDHPRIYALERMSNMVITDKQYKPQYQGSHEDYFRHAYEIQAATGDAQAIEIHLKADEIQSEYLKAKPIHASQQEIKTCVENNVKYTYFRLYLVPCYNFYQQLLGLREGIEITSPQMVRDEMMRIAKAIVEKYEDK